MRDSICLVTFSDNMDHQDVVYSMFHALKDRVEVYTIGLSNPKSKVAPHTERNLYVDGPRRPGIEAKTFRVDLLLKIASFVKRHQIQYLYFESQHIWNVPVMLLCRKCFRVQAVHDVIPHDGNRAMELCNFCTSRLSDHVILRNRRFKRELAQKCHISEDKITCFDSWRPYPPEEPVSKSGIYLCFGRIRRYKGFDMLLQIIEKCPEAQFRVVGSPDEESRPLVEKLKSLENVAVTDREVTFDEMVDYMREASWVVLPYSSGTQSGVILDAYRYARPVVAFDVGAISEQIENDKTGYLIPAGNVEAFAQTLQKISRFTEAENQAFSHNAYVFGYQKYAAQAVAEEFWGILRKKGNAERLA